MRQQINLYQTTVDGPTAKLSARTVGAGLAVLCAGLLAVWAFGLHQVSRLQQQLGALTQQQQTQQQFLDTIAAQRDATGNAATLSLTTQLQQVQRELAEHRQALTLLRSGAAGELDGFADKLAALARRRVDGVWLEHVALQSGAGVAGLSGGAINADLVPRYLQALSDESALAGSRFDQFGIEDVKANAEATNADASVTTRSGIHFHLTHTAVLAAPVEGQS